MIELSTDENGDVVCGGADDEVRPSALVLLLKLGWLVVVSIAGAALLMGVIFAIAVWYFWKNGAFLD